MESSAAGIAKGSAYLLASRIASNLISILALTFIARGLTVGEMGVSTALSLLITLGITLSRAGVPISAARFISEAKGKGERYDHFIMAALLARLLLSSLYISVVIGLSLYMPSIFWDQYHIGLDLLILALITMLALGMEGSLKGVLVGLNMMGAICLSGLIASIVSQPVAAILVVKGWGVKGYVIGWALGGITGSLSSCAFLAMALRGKKLRTVGAWRALKALLKFSWPILITDLAGFLFLWFDSFVIVLTGSPKELGLYSVALKVYSMITVVPLNIATALYPYYGEQYGRGKLEEIRAMTFAVSRYLSFLFIPAALGLAVVAEPTLIIFAGEKYAGSAPLLMVFGFFGSLTAFTPALSRLLITFKRTKALMVANLASVFISLLFASAAIHSLGLLLTVALARGIASVLLLGFYVLSTKDVASVDLRSLAKGLICSLIMATTVYVVELWLGSSIFSLAIYVAIGAFVYGVCLRVVRGLSYQDVLTLSGVLPGRSKKLLVMIGRLIAPDYLTDKASE